MSLMKGIFRYRCRRNPGKLYNTFFCYTYLTKDYGFDVSTWRMMCKYHVANDV